MKLTKKLPSWHKQLRQILSDRRFEAERGKNKSEATGSKFESRDGIPSDTLKLLWPMKINSFFRILLVNFKIRSIRSMNSAYRTNQSLKHHGLWVSSFGTGAIAKEDFGTFRRAIAILFSRRFGVKLDADVTAPRPQPAG